jgi:hypothetical protein
MLNVKKILLIAFFLLMFKNTFGQNLHLYNSHSNSISNLALSDKKEYDSSNRTELFLGLGLFTQYNYGTGFSPYIFLNINLHLYKQFFICFGYDLIQSLKHPTHFVNAFYLTPNIKVSTSNNKFSFFIGPGFYFGFPYISGLLISVKSEWNINRLFSLGCEWKQVYLIFEQQNQSEHPLLLPALYFSYKF